MPSTPIVTDHALAPIPGMRCIAIAAPRDGQLILTPFGTVKANRHGTWMTQQTIDYLMRSRLPLFEVEGNELSDRPVQSAISQYDHDEVMKVGSARPVGWNGFEGKQLDPVAEARIAEAAALARENASVAETPPQKQEMLQVSLAGTHASANSPASPGGVKPSKQNA